MRMESRASLAVLIGVAIVVVGCEAAANPTAPEVESAVVQRAEGASAQNAEALGAPTAETRRGPFPGRIFRARGFELRRGMGEFHRPQGSEELHGLEGLRRRIADGSPTPGMEARLQRLRELTERAREGGERPRGRLGARPESFGGSFVPFRLQGRGDRERLSEGQAGPGVRLTPEGRLEVRGLLRERVPEWSGGWSGERPSERLRRPDAR